MMSRAVAFDTKRAVPRLSAPRSFDISIAGGRPLHEIRTHADRVSAIDAFADLNSTHKPRRSGVAVVEGKGPRLQVFPEVEGYTPGMAAGYPPAGADGGSGGSRRLSRTGLDGVRADSGAQELSYASAGEGAAAALPRATTPGYAAPSSGGRSRRWDQGHGWGEGWVVGGENTTSVAPRVDAGRLSPTVPDVVSSAVVGPAAGAAAAVFGDSGSVGARSATSTSEKPEQALFRRKGRATSFQRAAALGMTGNGGHAGDHGGGKFAGRCGVGRNRRAVSSFSGYCLGHQSEERTDEDIEDRRGAYRTMTSRDNGFRSDDNVPVTAGGGRGGRGGGRGWGRGRGTGQPHEMGSLFAFAHDEPARLGKRQGYAGRGQGEFPRDVDEPRDENNLMYGWSMGNNEDGLDDGGDKDRGRGLGRDSGGGVGTRRDGHGEGQQQQVVLFTGSDDGTAKAWDAETGRLVRIYAGHSRGVTCLQATSTEVCACVCVCLCVFICACMCVFVRMRVRVILYPPNFVRKWISACADHLAILKSGFFSRLLCRTSRVNYFPAANVDPLPWLLIRRRAPALLSVTVLAGMRPGMPVRNSTSSVESCVSRGRFCMTTVFDDLAWCINRD